MLQSQRNKQTLEILKKLRNQGAPESSGTVSLDMTLSDGGDEQAPEPDDFDLEGRKPDSDILPAPSPGEPDQSGTVSDTTIPGLGRRKRRVPRA